MGCDGTGKLTELQFVSSMSDRRPGECRGPLVDLDFAAYQIELLEECFQSPRAHEVLWDGYLPGSPARLTFQLCAAHWTDLACVAAIRARQFERRDWYDESSVLLSRCWKIAHWDYKEIDNLLTWQRVELT